MVAISCGFDWTAGHILGTDLLLVDSLGVSGSLGCIEEWELMKNKFTACLICLCLALGIALGVTHMKLRESQELTVKQERQLKELYAQVDELTLQYIGIVKRIQGHGGAEQ